MSKEYWRPVLGYEYRYKVSSEGVVKAVGKRSYVLSQNLKSYDHSSDHMAVNLKDPTTGKYKQVKVAKLVWEAFEGAIPAGYGVIHANGMKSDNRLMNLRLISLQEMGRRYAGLSKRRGIVKIDASGEIVEAYRSSREAAEKNFCGYRTILKRCNGQVKNNDLFGGATFAWADVERRRDA